MLFQYAHALIGFLFGMVFVALQVWVLVRLLSPKVKEPMKDSTYECGEPPVGDAWVRFDMRFYTMALIFLIFEVEAVFLFPWAAVYNKLMAITAGKPGAWFPFIEVFLFVVILAIGLIYVWRKGDMDWVKTTMHGRFDDKHVYHVADDGNPDKKSVA
ncbi:MAG: NADH-quinone oxidoreductase subunit A [Planctomycetes bacterium]|nr:NADH-quinone oxidoreductase subunit A [Planctomycetota bacterium]